MHRGTITNSREDLQTITTSSYSYKSIGYENQSVHQQAKATTYYETDHLPTSRRPPRSPSTNSINNNNERAKSADHSRVAPMPSPASTTTPRLSRASNRIVGTRSSVVYIDEIRAAEEEGEKRELNLLNSRFGNYLDKIKHLANINANLRRQVDDAYRKYMGHTDEQHTGTNKNQKLNKHYQHPSEVQLNNLRKQINDEVRAQTLIQIRLQRADYDIKFYQNNIKLLSSHDQKQSEQIRIMRQKLEGNLQELEQFKQQYEKREQDLQTYKTQYNEYMNKLIECSNEYDNVTYQRMENENTLHTLKEQLIFEQEYHQQRQQEFEYLEKFHYDFNKEFNKNEFHNIVKKIRQDYQEFNAIRLSELETLYQTKLETIRNELLKRDEQQQETSKPREVRVAIDSTKKEHRSLIEQNQLLKDKLEQLEQDLHHIIEQNRQRYEISEREYQQLQMELPELDCIIVHLRENAVSLWSEINTYRYLLLNLLSPTNEKSSKSSSSIPIPTEKSVITEKNIPATKMINKVTTVGTKAQNYPQQYRDETTGFIVHIEDGIIWVRI